MNQIATIEQERAIIPVLKASLYPNASDESINLVLGYCRAAGLDPMQKPVHIVPMWDKNMKCMRDVIMPGIGLYRVQAARTGEYAGIGKPEYGPDVKEILGGIEVVYPEYCSVTVKRSSSGVIGDYTAIEYWKENYATAKNDTAAPNAMWKKRPRGQLAKCAEAQALRKAFPEVGAIPTAEEMEGKTIEGGMSEAEHKAIEFKELLEMHEESIAAIKGGIALNEYSRAAEAWFELSEDVQRGLWVAPSKGGPFTTEERKIIKTSEFRASYFGTDEAKE